jgi:predicted HTH domain antitoxin
MEPLDAVTERDLHQRSLHLFEAEQVTLSQGAKLAGLSLEGFIELLGQSGIDAVSYPAEDLVEELEAPR